MASVSTSARGWPPVIAHAFVAGLTQVYWLTYSPISTEAAQAYGTSKASITLLATVYAILYFVLAIPIGWLLDKNPRPFLIAGAVLTAAGAVLRAADPTSYAFGLAGQILVAIAQPVLLNGLILVAHHHLAPEKRSAGIALGSVGFFLGIFVGFTSPLLFLGEYRAGLVIRTPDLGPLLWFQAALGVAGAIAMVWTARHPIHTAVEVSGTHGIAALRAVLRDRGVRAVSVIALGGFGAFGAILVVLEQLLRPRGISRDDAALMVDGLVLAGLLVAAWAPAWAARRGRERSFLLWGLAAASFSCALLAIDLPVWATALALAVAGGLLVPALPIVLEIAERIVPELSGTASAVIWLAANLGVGIMTTVGQSLSGTPSLGFLAIAAGGFATVAYGAVRLTAEVVSPREPHEPADLAAAGAA